MTALRAQSPIGLSFVGCGGPLMAAKGMTSAFPIDRFSVMGPVDALRALPEALRRANELAQIADREAIDAAVLIDGWAFSRLVAKRIRKQTPDVKLFKYVAPQVWASRPHRAQSVEELFDGVLTLFEFEVAWFKRLGAKAAFVGHPIFQKAQAHEVSGEKFRAERGLGGAPLLAVLLGSRRGEVRRLAPPFLETVKLLMERHEGLRIVAPLAPAVEEEVRAVLADWPGDPVFASFENRFDAFAAADAALAASGTVTTELAIQGTPMAVAYKIHPLSAMWVRRVATTEYVSLINIAADQPILPEFLQEDCDPAAIAEALSRLLSSEAARLQQTDAFPAALRRLGVGGPPAAQRAAETILRWLKSP